MKKIKLYYTPNAYDLKGYKLHEGKENLTVSFFLLARSYTTIMIKKFFHIIKNKLWIEILR